MPSRHQMPSIRDLLAQGGFHLRTATRADCARCSGRSCGTVSYNAEVAHCFRCGWSANRYTLAREIGPTRQTRAGSRTKARREAQQRAKNEREIRAFERWREQRVREVSDRYYALSRAAARAAAALASGVLTPEEQELAWDALARFYHAEASLSAAFDFLLCVKASDWLEEDARIEDLFGYWIAIGKPPQ